MRQLLVSTIILVLVTFNIANHCQAEDGFAIAEFLGPAKRKLATARSSTSSSGFNIVLNFVNTPTPDQARAFTDAKEKWESIISGYQVSDIANQNLIINVVLAPIDGEGGILGAAGPQFAKLNAAQTDVSSGFVYADEGIMQFDTADVAQLLADGRFETVVLHEMGHVIGVGTLWSSSQLDLPGRQELYQFGSGQYSGTNGVSAYGNEFSLGAPFVPVELGGGAGTANAHWNEVDFGLALTGITNSRGQDFGNELMTGWLGQNTFLSSVTIASLIDLGFVIDVAGDFDGNFIVDGDDIDHVIDRFGATSASQLAEFDLTGDGQINSADLAFHVENLVQTTNGVCGTCLGDINLDGTVDVLGDAFILVANLGTVVDSYTLGDLNGDGTVNVLGDAFILVGNLGKSNSGN